MSLSSFYLTPPRHGRLNDDIIVSWHKIFKPVFIQILHISSRLSVYPKVTRMQKALFNIQFLAFSIRLTVWIHNNSFPSILRMKFQMLWSNELKRIQFLQNARFGARLFYSQMNTK